MSFGNIGGKCVQPFEMLGSTQESCVDNQMPGLTQMRLLRSTNQKESGSSHGNFRCLLYDLWIGYNREHVPWQARPSRVDVEGYGG